MSLLTVDAYRWPIFLRMLFFLEAWRARVHVVIRQLETIARRVLVFNAAGQEKKWGCYA